MALWTTYSFNGVARPGALCIGAVDLRYHQVQTLLIDQALKPCEQLRGSEHHLFAHWDQSCNSLLRSLFPIGLESATD
jgi:hypothetical protein